MSHQRERNYTTTDSELTRGGNRGDLPRTLDFHGDPVCELENQEEKMVFTEFLKIRASIDLTINL